MRFDCEKCHHRFSGADLVQGILCPSCQKVPLAHGTHLTSDIIYVYDKCQDLVVQIEDNFVYICNICHMEHATDRTQWPRRLFHALIHEQIVVEDRPEEAEGASFEENKVLDAHFEENETPESAKIAELEDIVAVVKENLELIFPGMDIDIKQKIRQVATDIKGLVDVFPEMSATTDAFEINYNRITEAYSVLEDEFNDLADKNTALTMELQQEAEKNIALKNELYKVVNEFDNLKRALEVVGNNYGFVLQMKDSEIPQEFLGIRKLAVNSFALREKVAALEDELIKQNEELGDAAEKMKQIMEKLMDDRLAEVENSLKDLYKIGQKVETESPATVAEIIEALKSYMESARKDKYDYEYMLKDAQHVIYRLGKEKELIESQLKETEEQLQVAMTIQQNKPFVIKMAKQLLSVRRDLTADKQQTVKIMDDALEMLVKAKKQVENLDILDRKAMEQAN